MVFNRLAETVTTELPFVNTLPTIKLTTKSKFAEKNYLEVSVPLEPTLTRWGT